MIVQVHRQLDYLLTLYSISIGCADKVCYIIYKAQSYMIFKCLVNLHAIIKIGTTGKLSSRTYHRALLQR